MFEYFRTDNSWFEFDHRIQQPITKLRILNLQEFFDQSDCFYKSKQKKNTSKE